MRPKERNKRLNFGSMSIAEAHRKLEEFNKWHEEREKRHKLWLEKQQQQQQQQQQQNERNITNINEKLPG